MTLSSKQQALVIAVGAYIVGMTTSIAAKSMYSNVKIGTDKKTLLISSAVAIGTTFALMRLAK